MTYTRRSRELPTAGYSGVMFCKGGAGSGKFSGADIANANRQLINFLQHARSFKLKREPGKI